MDLRKQYKRLFEGKVRSDDSSLLIEALARGLKPLLMIGSKVGWNTMSEDALLDLSDKFEDIDDEQADDIASHLNMSIELRQDGDRGAATKMMKQFNKVCKDVLKGKPIKSAFEGKVRSNDSSLTEAPMDRKGKMIKGFMPGDMWREDFDYIGMLKYGAQAHFEGLGDISEPNVVPMDIEELNALYESFTDVNYHREAQDLGNAIDWIEDQGEDANRTQEMVEGFMERFRKKCTETLKVMGIKWTPGR